MGTTCLHTIDPVSIEAISVPDWARIRSWHHEDFAAVLHNPKRQRGTARDLANNPKRQRGTALPLAHASGCERAFSDIKSTKSAVSNGREEEFERSEACNFKSCTSGQLKKVRR